MWMGGPVPLGYDARERMLVVNDVEAKLVRRIFDDFVSMRSATLMVKGYADERLVTKGGKPFTKQTIERRRFWPGNGRLGTLRRAAHPQRTKPEHRAARGFWARKRARRISEPLYMVGQCGPGFKLFLSTPEYCCGCLSAVCQDCLFTMRTNPLNNTWSQSS